MQLELTELLACPRCGPPHGLIAFVERMERRRIDLGHLDCPICEDRHPIRAGTVWFGAGSEPPAAQDAADADAAAATAAALLGASSGGETILFGPGSAAMAAGAADLRPDARVISFGTEPARQHDRVYSFVVPELEPRRLPLRDQCLDGVVLAGVSSGWIGEAARVLRPGARLVVVEPGEDADAPGAIPPDVSLRVLATDPRAWVAVRT